MEPAAFLNLDLDIWSNSDLSQLARYLDQHACLLYSGEVNGVFHITAEPLIGGHSNIDPRTCTRELLDTLASLPSDLKSLFEGCHLRIFDYGFDGGVDAPPCRIDLPADQLSRMAQMGLDIRVTVYPYHADPPSLQGGAEIDA
jgi:hypothetical protein